MDYTLDYKISIFYELFNRNEIMRENYTEALSKIYRGMIANFYYLNLSRLPPTFEGIYQMMKTNFEGKE